MKLTTHISMSIPLSTFMALCLTSEAQLQLELKCVQSSVSTTFHMFFYAPRVLYGLDCILRCKFHVTSNLLSLLCPRYTQLGIGIPFLRSFSSIKVLRSCVYMSEMLQLYGICTFVAVWLLSYPTGILSNLGSTEYNVMYVCMYVCLEKLREISPYAPLHSPYVQPYSEEPFQLIWLADRQTEIYLLET
jgi:hypothetical protein